MIGSDWGRVRGWYSHVDFPIDRIDAGASPDQLVDDVDGSVLRRAMEGSEAKLVEVIDTRSAIVELFEHLGPHLVVRQVNVRWIELPGASVELAEETTSRLHGAHFAVAVHFVFTDFLKERETK